jgi:hypothetical protein
MRLQLFFIKRRTYESILYIAIPLVLSAFMHLWNPVGFPLADQDEGHYMRRAMQVLEGLGPQDPGYVHPYDHPYFGQLFLASVLKVIGYPDLLQPKVGDIHSIEMLYFIPRFLMGVLAVIDTFLVYKIAETRYNRKVAFIAATLFAVMPFSWILRRVILDSIQLPLILLSILFALYTMNSTTFKAVYIKKNVRYSPQNLNVLTTLLSGVFLGLAIFMKIPAFSIVPLIALIYAYNKNFKALGLWLVPVVIIPMIWPAYAISQGQFDEWVDGVMWQTDRGHNRPLSNEMDTMFSKIDPLLFALAAIGIIYAWIKRDYFLLLWVIPYLIVLFLVDWVYFFHFILVFPAFCIAAALLFTDLAKKKFKARILRPLIFSLVGIVVVFGSINSLMLITTNLNSSYFDLVSSVSRQLPSENINDNSYSNYDSYNNYNYVSNYYDNNYSNNTVTLVGPNSGWSFYWVIKYAFDRDVEYEWFEYQNDYIKGPISSKKFLLMVDRDMRSAIFLTNNSDKQQVSQVRTLYNISTPLDYFFGDTLRYNLDKYPYTNINDDIDVRAAVKRMRGVDWTTPIEIRANYWNH